MSKKSIKELRREIYYLEARALKDFIKEKHEFYKGNENESFGVIFEVTKSEEKIAKPVFYEVLGEHLYKYIHFKRRKLNKQEMELKMMLAIVPVMLLLALGVFLLFFLEFFGLGDFSWGALFFAYLVNVIGFVIGLMVLTRGIREKVGLSIGLGLFCAFLNGVIMLMNMAELYS